MEGARRIDHQAVAGLEQFLQLREPLNPQGVNHRPQG